MCGRFDDITGGVNAVGTEPASAPMNSVKAPSGANPPLSPVSILPCLLCGF